MKSTNVKQAIVNMIIRNQYKIYWGGHQIRPDQFADKVVDLKIIKRLKANAEQNEKSHI